MPYQAFRFTGAGQQVDVASPFFEFDEACHSMLIDELIERPSDYPMLQRLSDEFKDARFHAREVPDLIEQAQKLGLRTSSTPLAAELGRFVAVLRHLENGGLNLFFFAD